MKKLENKEFVTFDQQIKYIIVSFFVKLVNSSFFCSKVEFFTEISKIYIKILSKYPFKF
jgi:hypothetical protein